MRVLIFLISISLGAGSFGSLQGSDDYPWKAALATRDITPEVGVWMAGYAARKTPSESIQQPLFAKAFALEDADGNRLVTITLDLLGVPVELRREIEAYALEVHQLPPGSLILNASHTHCGPVIRAFHSPGPEERALLTPEENLSEVEEVKRARQISHYVAAVKRAMTDLIDETLTALEPAILEYKEARCGFAMNRRTPGPNSSWKNSPNPEAPVDHEVPVLQVFNEERELKGILFGYACHATTLSIMAINGDWPGYAQQYLEEDHPGAIAMFINGASADQNPYPRRLQVYVERHGRALATAVEAALETPPVEIAGPLRAKIAWQEIRYQAAPSEEVLRERLASSDRYEARYAAFLLDEIAERGSLPASYPVPVQVVLFGETMTWITMGGEVVVDYSLRLKKELSAESDAPVWFAGYSNDVMTYIPSQRVLEEGGYEGGEAMRFIRSAIHSAPWEATIEETLVGVIHDLRK